MALRRTTLSPPSFDSRRKARKATFQGGRLMPGRDATKLRTFQILRLFPRFLAFLMVAGACAVHASPASASTNSSAQAVAGVRNTIAARSARKAKGNDGWRPLLPLFLPPASYPSNSNGAFATAAADLNHDGHIDVVVAGEFGV